MNKLSISPEARKDLEEIKAYITDELENPTAAINVVSRITQSLKKLKDMPGIGTPLSSKLSLITDILANRRDKAIKLLIKGVVICVLS